MDFTEAFGTMTRHPGLVWMVLAMISGQFFKLFVFTRERATEPGRFRKFWLWGRKTLAWHPVLVGAVIGQLWPGTVEEQYEGGSLGASIYFGAFGGLAVWAFEALKGIGKKYGINLEHHESSPPPPTPAIPSVSSDPDPTPGGTDLANQDDIETKP